MAKDLTYVAYCGLCCKDCFSYQGKIADLARDLRKELRDHKFDKTAGVLGGFSFFKVFKKYKDCYEVLGGLVRLRCKKPCREGGGNPFCAMKKCTKKKKIQGCWECELFESCKKMDFLRGNHGVAHIKNLKILKKKGVKEFIKGKRHMYVKA